MDAKRWRKARGAWHLAVLALAWILCWAPSVQAQTPAGRGYLDQAELPHGAHELTLSGWAVSERPHVFIHNLIVLLGDREGLIKGRAPLLDIGRGVDAGRRESGQPGFGTLERR